MTTPTLEDRSLAALHGLGISPTVVAHPAVSTVEEWAAHREAFPATTHFAKNMFLKGKKGELVLVFAMADTKTDLNRVCAAVGAPKGSLRFAAPEVLLESLGVTAGAVTPLALVHDGSKGVTFVMDTNVLHCPGLIAVHPCRNDKSVLLTPNEIVKFVSGIGCPYFTVDFTAAPDAAAPAQTQPKVQAKAAAKPVAAAPADDGETKLRMMTAKDADFAGWYTELVVKSEMIEYYDVSGCYIIRPWAYAIWEQIQRYFGDRIAAIGVEGCYFPMFVSRKVLEREKDHVEGFAPEVAWVTKAGNDDLENPIALRPTSETVMYPYFAKWIRSHRDLPLRINQWCNVVRWEFSHPTPFIRTREFLWQEGHCAWATHDECEAEVLTILDLYRDVYEELLAVPVVRGVKTEKERFAGGLRTTSVEAFIPAVGRGCQGATSHNLGQNFAKMFDIAFDQGGARRLAWQNSWGLSTRTIGVMTMVHGDDRGLVLPPRVAQVQVVIVPVGITNATTPQDAEAIVQGATKLQELLTRGGIRARADLRSNYTPGWRFNYWELKGVPLRLSVGPRELERKSLEGQVRYQGRAVTLAWDDNLPTAVHSLLNEVHTAMLENARRVREERTVSVTEWPDFVPALNRKCLLLAPWCGSMECEDAIKKDSGEESAILLRERQDERAPSMGAKTLCIPFDQPAGGVDGLKCICKRCTQPATQWVLFGRSY